MFPSHPRVQTFQSCCRAFSGPAAIILILAASGCGGNPKWSEQEARAIEALREIHQAQIFFQEAGFLDTDRDGIGDYGTLDMLADPDGRRGVQPLMNPLYTTQRVGKYELYVRLVPGEGEESPPYWECRAFTSDKKLRCFYVDTSGVIRYADRRETVNAKSPPVEGPTAEA